MSINGGAQVSCLAVLCDLRQISQILCFLVWKMGIVITNNAQVIVRIK